MRGGPCVAGGHDDGGDGDGDGDGASDGDGDGDGSSQEREERRRVAAIPPGLPTSPASGLTFLLHVLSETKLGSTARRRRIGCRGGENASCRPSLLRVKVARWH